MSLLLPLAMVLLALGLAAYPPGPSPVYQLPDETIQASVPPRLVAMGYPPYVSVSRRYLEERFGGSYSLMANETFREDGIYDHSLGRVLTPGEAARAVIGRSDRVAVNYVKIALLASSAALLAAAAAGWGGAGGSRAEPAGGYIP